MENQDLIKTNEPCDSPVYVSSNVNSPVNSPVFVSKESEHESSTQFTEKLILPTLNDDIIVSDTSRKNVSATTTTTTTISSSSSNVILIEDVPVNIDETVNETTPATANANTTEMVKIVIKDFKYCQEEFLKQVKENNLSVSAESIMRLLRIAMIIVEQTKESGSNKKEFVIKLLKDVVMNNASMLTEHKLEVLNLINGNIVSDSIDFIIDASRGKFDVNKVEKVVEEIAKTCFAKCWERILKKN
jgi:hypothetical protein